MAHGAGGSRSSQQPRWDWSHIRLRLHESPLFQEIENAKEITHAPRSHTLHQQWHPMLILGGYISCNVSYAIFGGTAPFVATYLLPETSERYLHTAGAGNQKSDAADR